MSRAKPVPPRYVLLGELKKHKRRDLVAKLHKVAPSTVTQWCSILKITRSDYGSNIGFVATKRPTEELFLQAVADFGMDIEAIGKRFNATRYAAIQWFDHYGVERTRKRGLEPEDVPLVRALEGELSADDVGEKFEVHARTIRDVWSRKSWQHIR